MSFVSDLRMNGIYGNPGELGPPNLHPGINLDEIGNLLSMVRAHHALDAQNQMQMAGPQGGHLSNISQSMNQAPIVPPAYPNTVLGDQIGALDKAKLGIEAAKLGEKKTEFGQNIAEKKTEFGGKQDINQQKVDISSQRADTSQFSADTRRQLAELHDLPDSEKLRLLQEGKVDIQHIRDAASLAQIGARGTESRKTLTQSGQQQQALEGTKQSGRMEIERFKQDNKNFIFKEIPGGNIIAFDPTDPSKVIDTGVHSGRLSDKEKQEFGIKAIEARGQQQRETLGIRGEQRINEINTKAGTQKPSALNTSRDQVNRARELFNTRPDLKPFISFDDKGQPVIDMTNSTTEQQNEIRSRIYGKNLDIELPKDKNKQNSNDNQNMRRPIPGSNKMAISKDGGKTWKVE